jgi:hypothetical protein
MQKVIVRDDKKVISTFSTQHPEVIVNSTIFSAGVGETYRINGFGFGIEDDQVILVVVVGEEPLNEANLRGE